MDLIIDPAKIGFTSSNGLWLVRYADTTGHFPSLTGLALLSAFNDAPQRWFSSIELRRLAIPGAGRTRSMVKDEQFGQEPQSCRALAVSDRLALQAYKRQLDDFDDEIAEANENHDHARSERLQHMRHELMRHFSTWHGRSRRFGAAAESARVAVYRALNTAYRHLRKAGAPFDDLAEHFESHVWPNNGHFNYRPDCRRQKRNPWRRAAEALAGCPVPNALGAD